MRTNSSRQAMILALGLLLAIPGIATAAAPRKPVDMCLVTRDTVGTPIDTIVIQDVTGLLNPGRSMSLHGFFFIRGGSPAPFEGSAVMASDGTLRLGLFVHTLAVLPINRTLEGITDEFFAGTLKVDLNGDFQADFSALFESVDCATITLP